MLVALLGISLGFLLMVLHLHLQHILMLWVFMRTVVCVDGDGLLYICGVSAGALLWEVLCLQTLSWWWREPSNGPI